MKIAESGIIKKTVALAHNRAARVISIGNYKIGASYVDSFSRPNTTSQNNGVTDSLKTNWRSLKTRTKLAFWKTAVVIAEQINK